MKNILTTLVLSILYSHLILGQCFTETKNSSYLTIAYLGEKIFHPGFSASYSWKLQSMNDSTFRCASIYAGINTNGYIHPRSHLGIQIKPFAEINVPINKNFEIGILGDFGFMRRTYHGHVYTVDDNGEVILNHFAGQNALVYGFYIIGLKKIEIRKESISKIFFQVGAFWEFPYNNNSLIHPVLLIGVKRGIAL